MHGVDKAAARLQFLLSRRSSGAEQHSKLRPDMFDDLILRQRAHGLKRPGYLL